MTNEIDREEAMKYCQIDQIFNIALKKFIEQVPQFAKELREFCEAGNAKDYQVSVHSLKASARTIGALDLFEESLELEIAAKEENFAKISTGTEALLAHAREVAEEAASMLP